jgi:hypothetical protein
VLQLCLLSLGCQACSLLSCTGCYSLPAIGFLYPGRLLFGLTSQEFALVAFQLCLLSLGCKARSLLSVTGDRSTFL